MAQLVLCLGAAADWTWLRRSRVVLGAVCTAAVVVAMGKVAVAVRTVAVAERIVVGAVCRQMYSLAVRMMPMLRSL